MHEQSVALITGANKGIGLQVAKDLLAHGLIVLIGSRDQGRGETAAASLGAGAHAIQLDVTDATSIAAAAMHIRDTFGRLDVLVNNAGISHTGQPGTPLADIIAAGHVCTATHADVQQLFETNVIGVIAVTQAMLPLLRAAPMARIVNISSGTASLARNADAGNPRRATFGIYSATKTALNAITVALAAELEADGIKVNAAAPGYTATDLNNFEGTRTVEQAAREPVRLALLGADGPSGAFMDENGPVPW